jgi:hypothetical protein
MELHLRMDHPAAPRCDLRPSHLAFSCESWVQDAGIGCEPAWYDSPDVVSLEWMQACGDPVRIFDRLARGNVLPTHRATMPPSDR